MAQLFDVTGMKIVYWWMKSFNDALFATAFGFERDGHVIVNGEHLESLMWELWSGYYTRYFLGIK
jgi:hypothetical protein